MVAIVRFCYKKVTFSSMNLSIFEHKRTLIKSCAFSSSNDFNLSTKFRFFCNHIQVNEILYRQVAVYSHEPLKVSTFEPWFMSPCNINIKKMFMFHRENIDQIFFIIF